MSKRNKERKTKNLLCDNIFIRGLLLGVAEAAADVRRDGPVDVVGIEAGACSPGATLFTVGKDEELEIASPFFVFVR